MELKHGLSLYKRGLCKCAKCKDSNRRYESRQREKLRRHNNDLPLLPFIHDTLTLEEFKRFRAEA